MTRVAVDLVDVYPLRRMATWCQVEAENTEALLKAALGLE